MKSSLILVVLGAILGLSLAAALPAGTPAAKIITANPSRIFDEMRETLDMRAKIAEDGKALDAERAQRQNKIKSLEDARRQIGWDDPKASPMEKQIDEAKADLERWMKQVQVQLQNAQKQRIRDLYDKILTAVETVATQRGVDLVLTEYRPTLPPDLDAIPYEQVRAILVQRNILYTSGSADISKEVVTILDNKYKSADNAPKGGL